ncbi:hypothetical protein DPMN_077996 [Dreissena polymorpha]|uniref:Uncharacterized protein n=1 Tax=Dreissena polymorpha TaxID=45954 RepID=A0A9D3YPS5_DREPO|nr:hypothetical protein DPMN_077996 [Dreissena polymorpha]
MISRPGRGSYVGSGGENGRIGRHNSQSRTLMDVSRDFFMATYAAAFKPPLITLVTPIVAIVP